MFKSTRQKLMIPFIGDPLLADQNDIGSKIRTKGVVASVDKVNWEMFDFHPFVQVFVGYSERHLWLHYEVRDDFYRAKATTDQEAVWEDSCVEFFMSENTTNDGSKQFEEDIIYRNFEFNALGICLSACGTKLSRAFLSTDELNQILRFPSLDKLELPNEGDVFNWKLSVAIPLRWSGLQPGSTFRANLYKCGDLTRQPHFLSWNSIESASPDFHLPQFFGEMKLVI